jgi:hypothetical protein
MSSGLCNECGFPISAGDPWVQHDKWGQYCKVSCMLAFLDALKAAGIDTDLREGEEPNVIY